MAMGIAAHLGFSPTEKVPCRDEKPHGFRPLLHAHHLSVVTLGHGHSSIVTPFTCATLVNRYLMSCPPLLYSIDVLSSQYEDLKRHIDPVYLAVVYATNKHMARLEREPSCKGVSGS